MKIILPWTIRFRPVDPPVDTHMGFFKDEEVNAYKAFNKCIPDIKTHLRTLADTEAEEKLLRKGANIFCKHANVIKVQEDERLKDHVKWTGAATLIGVGVYWHFGKVLMV
jgi:hypothetical protein